MSARRSSPVLYFVPGIWSLVMYLAQLSVVAVVIGILRQTGIRAFCGLTSPIAGQQGDPGLITDGWYGVVRHPLYLFSIIFMALNPVMTLQWLLLTVMGTAYLLAGAVIEERRLKEAFGEQYSRYQRETPFIIPWPARRDRKVTFP
jgi:protein-S-isoprenylcysteine O-methyltransferase Ste14